MLKQKIYRLLLLSINVGLVSLAVADDNSADALVRPGAYIDITSQVEFFQESGPGELLDLNKFTLSHDEDEVEVSFKFRNPGPQSIFPPYRVVFKSFSASEDVRLEVIEAYNDQGDPIVDMHKLLKRDDESDEAKIKIINTTERSWWQLYDTEISFQLQVRQFKDDSDDDGVLDISDLCPATPQDVSVRDNGCPYQSFVALDKKIFNLKEYNPNYFEQSFSIKNPATEYTLHISVDRFDDNDDMLYESVLLNGKKIKLDDDDEWYKQDLISIPVTLLSENTLRLIIDDDSDDDYDADDNEETGAKINVWISGVDRDAPIINAQLSQPANANGWHNQDVTVSFTCDDATSSIVECAADQIVSSEGKAQQITGVARDIAGNEASVTVTINLDKTAPLITSTAAPEANAAGWNNTDVQVSYSCQDPLSGIEDCSPSVLLNKEGKDQAVTGVAKDLAGNEASTTDLISIDKTAPAIQAAPSVPANSAGWHNIDLSVNFTCADTLSGIADCTAPVFVSTEAAGQLISGVAIDIAGNSTAAQLVINLDKTAPLITGTQVPSANAAGWNNSDVQVNYSCTDSLSGVDSCSPPNVFTVEGEGQQSLGSAIDVAGNEASVASTINIDKTPPTITASPSIPANAAGWHNQDLSVNFECADTLSGIADCNAPIDVDTEAAEQIISGVAIDIAGNSTTAQQLINLDKTAPVVITTPNPPANIYGWNNTDVALSYQCQDTLSGIVSCPPLTLVESEGSSQIIQHTVLDYAGNQTVVESSISIDKTPPVISASPSIPANAAGWHNSDFEVDFNCNDALSGIDQCSESFAVVEESTALTVIGSALDRAGNTATTELLVNLDKTPPSISVLATPAANANGWNNSDVQLTYSCIDALVCPGPITVSTEGAAQQFDRTVVDIADNTASVSATLNIDKTAPQISISQPPSGTILTAAAVTVSGAVTDTLSPPQEVICPDSAGAQLAADGSFQCPLTLIPGDNYLDFTTQDLAGNIGTLKWFLHFDDDADDDGVRDSLDLCPDTPLDEPADANGCSASQRDSDGDGYNDAIDRFVFDPTEWADLDNDGIGDNSDPDRDGDGYNNDIEAQVGTDPNDAASVPPDLDGDGIPDSLDDDRDGDGVNNPADAFPDDPNESSDLDGDGIGDNADPDRDGDGVDNAQDLFPNDGNHSAHPPVNNLSAQAQQQQVEVSWQPPVIVKRLIGYHIYRADFGSPAYSQLNSSLLSDTLYTDTTVANGQAYSYRVVAVADTNAEGEFDQTADVFVAYNQNSVSDVSAQREGLDGRLDWPALASMRYRVYRGTDAATLIALTDVQSNSYLDTSALWNTAYTYRIDTLADFTNPISGQAVEVAGPAGPTAELAVVPPISISLNDAVPADDGVLELTLNSPTTISLTGGYQHAAGPVTVLAESGSEQVSSTASGGNYNLAVAAAPATSWTLTVSETATPPRSSLLNFRFVADTVPPQITLETASQISTAEDLIEVLGTAIDANSGIQAVAINSDRYPGQPFGALLGADGQFSAEVPVEFGQNSLTVVATDTVGNKAEASILVNRDIPLAPQLQITAPLNGSLVEQGSIDVQGVVYSGLAAEQLKVLLGNKEFYVTAGAQPGIFAFNFDSVPLTLGTNYLTVRVESPVAEDNETIAVLYQQPTAAGTEPPPLIDILSPRPDTAVSGSNVIVSGTVSSAVGVDSVNINSEVITLLGANNTVVGFDHQISLPADGSYDIEILATDSDGQSSTEILTVLRDSQPPTISLDSALLTPPAVNTVQQLPYPFSGSVTDASLAGLTINGNEVGLLPGVGSDDYVFDVNLNLALAQQQTVTVEAWDRAGQRSQAEVIVLADLPVQVEIISPAENAELTTSGANATIPVTLRTTGYTADYAVRLRVDDAVPETATVTDGLVNTTVNAPAASGEYSLIVDVWDISGVNEQLVSTAERRFSLINTDVIPLALERSEPANGSDGHEPNTPVNLYFNRPLDPALLSVNVRETVHGLVYEQRGRNANPSAFKAPPRLIEVNKDQEAVPGGLSVLADQKTIVFYAEQDFGYSGTVFVDISYDGTELARFSFQVRPLPTFVRGIVVDALRQKMPGVTISLPELKRSTVSDRNGAFSFGFGDSAQQAIPGGLYQLVINPDLRDPHYGSVNKKVRIEEGRLNNLPSLIVPLLNPNLAFQRIGSGQSQAILAGGDLVLDLSQVQLNFTVGPQAGLDRGDVHIQFSQINELNFSSHPAASTPWVYAVQPPGIELSGSPGISMQLPLLYGNRVYAPPDGTLVALVGFDAENELLIPVGVGEISNNRVVSVGSLNLSRLDYLGYSFIGGESQTVLADYRDGKLGYSELVGALGNIIEGAQATP